MTAFCQLYALKYRDKLGLAGEKGTYTINFTLWPYVSTETLGMRTVEWKYKVSSNSKKTWPVTICL